MNANVVLFLLCAVAAISPAQSSTEDRSLTQGAPVRDYWIDPSTGLIWAAKDNGGNISWKKAIKYCRDLRIGGYSDWTLPSIDELQGIYDGSGFAAAPPRNGAEWGLAGKPKGGLFLTGAREWSSTRVLDDRGHSSGYAWQFDFPHGKRWPYDPIGHDGGLRALCVRSPEVRFGCR